MKVPSPTTPTDLRPSGQDLPGERDLAAAPLALQGNTQVHAEIRFLPVDGCAVLNPTAWVYLWGTAGLGQHASLCDECRAVYAKLLAVARAGLPSPVPEVTVEFWPPEPALFESSRGIDEVRLRIRAIATAPLALTTWSRALHDKLVELGIRCPGTAGPATAPLPST